MLDCIQVKLVLVHDGYDIMQMSNSGAVSSRFLLPSFHVARIRYPYRVENCSGGYCSMLPSDPQQNRHWLASSVGVSSPVVVGFVCGQAASHSG